MALIKHLLATYNNQADQVYVLYDSATLVIQAFGGSSQRAEGWAQIVRPTLRTRHPIDIPAKEVKEEDISGWLVQMVRDPDSGQLEAPFAIRTRGAGR